MLYIIGLGLNEKGISIEGKEALKKCNKIYLENYTVEFPYKINKLKKIIGEKIVILNREYVESDKLILEAKKYDIALLIYGSPLSATTHVTLIEGCIDKKVKYKVVYSGSVLDAVAESGLQLYKFGKIASMPLWKNNFKPESFLDLIKENQSIGAHSLILIDIELNFNESLNQLTGSFKNKNINIENFEKSNLKFSKKNFAQISSGNRNYAKFSIEKILVCSQLGIKNKYFYGKINELKNKKIEAPFCFIIPGKMHFLEEKMIGRFSI